MFRPFARNAQVARIARGYLWSIPLVAAMGMASGLLEGAGIGLLIPLLGSLIGSDVAPRDGLMGLLGRFASGVGQRDRLLIVAGAMLGLVVVKNVLQTGSRLLVADVDGRASHAIRCALADRLLAASYPFHLAHDPARLVNIVATESWHASDAIRAEFSRIESSAVSAAFVGILMLISWRLTLFVMVAIVALRALQSLFLRPLAALGERVTASNGTLFERMLASVYQTRVIRLFGRRFEERRLFDEASDQVRRSMYATSKVSALVWPAMEILHAGLLLAVLLVAASMNVTLPEIAAFLVLMNRLQPHIRAVEAATTALAAANGQVAEVEWLLAAVDPQEDERCSKTPLEALDHSIDFREVSYCYPSRPLAPSLSNVSFRIRARRSTALIGPSGSGKSTIVNLLCRLLDPASGSISVDGVDLARIPLASWLETIGIAGQDIDLADGSIEANIRFGRHGLSKGDIEAAARQANAHDFIMSLPDDYATHVGTRGHSLSGGQRQRIGVARAIARRPAILIFDEATSSVDAQSESVIFDVLHKLPYKPTIIVVSHRVSTLALCDDAIVIEAGLVVEQGVLEESRAYRRMLASA